jgi:hypothetical protein
VPVFCLVLVLTGNVRWLLRWPTWASLAVFLAFFSLARTQAGSAGHFDRIAGIGLTVQPLAFYGKDAVQRLLSLAHIGFKDWAPEYPAMNVVLGVALLGGVAIALLLRKLRDDAAVRTCLAIFLTAFCLLAFVDTTYNEEANLAPQAWYWADLTLLPAALLAGVAAARGGWAGRVVAIGVVAGALLGGMRLADDRLGSLPVKGASLPGLLAPADGRLVEVRTGFVTCAVCDQDPPIALRKVEVKDGDLWRAPRPDEVTVHDPGGRSLALRASPDAIYALQYDVTDGRSAST